MRFMGEPALGIAVSMKSGGDILMLGEALQAEFARLQQELPPACSWTRCRTSRRR